MVQEDKILEILLGIQKNVSSLKDDVSSLKDDVSSLKVDVSSLKVDVSSLKDDVSSLKVDVADIKADVSSLKVEVADIKQRQIRMDNRQNEQHDFLRVLLRNQEVAHAALEELRLTTAKIESVQQVQQEVDLLGRKVYDMAVAKWCRDYSRHQAPQK